jgi:glucokinase
MLCRMLLAGDLGGTKTLLGLFKPTTSRPDLLDVRTYTTLDFSSLSAMVSAFLAATGIRPSEVDVACVGVAGPIVKQAVDLTNVPWSLDAREMMASTGIRRVWLLNDVEAMASAVPVLDVSELHTLQPGTFNADGNACLLAAGTGLGQAMLTRQHGRLVPSPSEGGHADYAARTDREVALLRFLRARYGRVSNEHIVSGPGLVNLLRFTSDDASLLLSNLDEEQIPAAVTQRGLAGSDPHCIEALELFLQTYGSAAGNMALQCVATGGVYLGGGIPSKILDAFDRPSFLEAFTEKPPLDDLLRRMPVHVILNREAGLLGAAAYGATLVKS